LWLPDSWVRIMTSSTLYAEQGIEPEHRHESELLAYSVDSLLGYGKRGILARSLTKKGLQ
jgi:hypothetical protein